MFKQKTSGARACYGVSIAIICLQYTGYNNLNVEDIISTRRLIHVVRAYSIFGDKLKAIKMCLNRFDEETKQSFLELYDKVDADVDITKEEVV